MLEIVCGIRTSIGEGGWLASSSRPINQTARIGTRTSPSPSMAAATVRSCRPCSAACAWPKRWRSARPAHHRAIVATAQIASGKRSRSPDTRVCRPSRAQTATAPDRVRLASRNCGHSRLQTWGDSGEGSLCSKVCSTTSPRNLVRRSSSWSARAITTSHCLTRLSLIVACSVSRPRSAFTASVSAGWSGPGLTSSGARSFFVSASSLRATAAAAKAAARTSDACSRRASISAGTRLPGRSDRRCGRAGGSTAR